MLAEGQQSHSMKFLDILGSVSNKQGGDLFTFILWPGGGEAEEWCGGQCLQRCSSSVTVKVEQS